MPWYDGPHLLEHLETVPIIEGRNRQLRRMFEQIGHHVEKIKRVKYGPLVLDVAAGESRALTGKEVERLRASAGLR